VVDMMQLGWYNAVSHDNGSSVATAVSTVESSVLSQCGDQISLPPLSTPWLISIIIMTSVMMR